MDINSAPQFGHGLTQRAPVKQGARPLLGGAAYIT